MPASVGSGGRFRIVVPKRGRPVAPVGKPPNLIGPMRFLVPDGKSIAPLDESSNAECE
jgi:hypothetical protein